MSSKQSGKNRALVTSRIIDQLLPSLAVLAALVVGAILLLMLGANPLKAYWALFNGALGT